MRNLRLEVDVEERGYSKAEPLRRVDSEIEEFNKRIAHMMIFADFLIWVGDDRELWVPENQYRKNITVGKDLMRVVK